MKNSITSSEDMAPILLTEINDSGYDFSVFGPSPSY